MNTQFGFEPYIEESLRLRLKTELTNRRAKNDTYSLRAFARDLKISHAALSEFLNGRRRFSIELGESLIQKLGIVEADKAHLIKSQKMNPLNYLTLNESSISLSREWYIEALSELVKIKDFKGDSAWIAATLGMDPMHVEPAIEHLLELGWVEIDDQGHWRVKEDNTTTLGNIKAKEDIYHLLHQFTKLQLKAIEKGRPEEGSLMGITFAIDPDDLPEARKLVYEFINNMSKMLERKTAEKKEVYRLNVALFPLSKAQESST